MRMPKVDGCDVLKFMKNDSLLKKIPIIVLSTASDPQILNKSYEFGCDVYIVKPVDYGKFVETISKISRFLSIVEVPCVAV
jgi:CheY-like chemotaxis protein